MDSRCRLCVILFPKNVKVTMPLYKLNLLQKRWLKALISLFQVHTGICFSNALRYYSFKITKFMRCFMFFALCILHAA